MKTANLSTKTICQSCFSSFIQKHSNSKKRGVSIGLLFTILFKKFEIASEMPHRTEKLIRDREKLEIAKFEIARLFLGKRTVSAQGTETFVRNSEVFEIARVRDSEGRLYIHCTGP